MEYSNGLFAMLFLLLLTLAQLLLIILGYPDIFVIGDTAIAIIIDI